MLMMTGFIILLLIDIFKESIEVTHVGNQITALSILVTIISIGTTMVSIPPYRLNLLTSS